MQQTTLPQTKRDLTITEMIVTPVACPDPPLLNHHGIHGPYFLRAVVRLRTADGFFVQLRPNIDLLGTRNSQLGTEASGAKR